MAIVRAESVTKQYGDVTALDELTLSVEEGATFGLLGTNGAGKTTLFKLLVGHIRPDAGRLEVDGMDVSTAGVRIRESVGYLPERGGFPGSLTGREVVRFHARMRGIRKTDRRDRIDDVLETVGLADASDRRVAGYSNGMNRRLGLATALLARPRILLLDEPTAGLDPRGVSSFHRIVRTLNEETDLTLVLSSHVLAEVEKLCDSVAIVHDGRLRAAGTLSELNRRYGGGLLVTVRLDRPEETDAAVATAGEHGGRVDSATRGVVTVACRFEEAFTVLAALREEVDLVGFEVQEPGLERVFEEVIDDATATEGPA